MSTNMGVMSTVKMTLIKNAIIPLRKHDKDVIYIKLGQLGSGENILTF